jgi:hypothetical protein
MSKIKPIVLAVMLAGPAAWVLAPSISNTGTQQAALATPDQVNAYQLMSVSKNLPLQSYQPF